MPVIAPPRQASDPTRSFYRFYSTQRVGAAFIRVALHNKGAHLPTLVGSLAFRAVYPPRAGLLNGTLFNHLQGFRPGLRLATQMLLRKRVTEAKRCALETAVERNRSMPGPGDFPAMDGSDCNCLRATSPPPFSRLVRRRHGYVARLFSLAQVLALGKGRVGL